MVETDCYGGHNPDARRTDCHYFEMTFVTLVVASGSSWAAGPFAVVPTDCWQVLYLDQGLVGYTLIHFAEGKEAMFSQTLKEKLAEAGVLDALVVVPIVLVRGKIVIYGCDGVCNQIFSQQENE